MRYNPIPIFYYHSVSATPDPLWYKSFVTFNVTFFEDFLKYLFSNRYEFLFLDDYFERRSDPSAGKKKMICLTFDDGYLDNYVYVYPLLKKYKAKGTIFVSPQYIQDNPEIRLTIEDVWSGKIRGDELHSSGFLSWKEMNELVQSGVMDIQSHSLSHTKYYSGDTIREFHHPFSDYLYPVGNLYPERLPYYITDPGFKNLIPYGTPFFEERSSLICKRVFINEQFEKECIKILNGYDWNNYVYKDCYEKTRKLYDHFRSREELIIRRETDKEYLDRVTFEITESKRILEFKLSKNINHICWPHGDYNQFCHETAIRSGYRSSHIVLKPGETNQWPDRFDRTGSSMVRRNRTLSLWKAIYKLDSYRATVPYIFIKKIYERIR